MESLTSTPTFRASTQIMSEPDTSKYEKVSPPEPDTLCSYLDIIARMQLHLAELLSEVDNYLDIIKINESTVEHRDKIVEDFINAPIFTKCIAIKHFTEGNVAKLKDISKRIKSYL